MAWLACCRRSRARAAMSAANRRTTRITPLREHNRVGFDPSCIRTTQTERRRVLAGLLRTFLDADGGLDAVGEATGWREGDARCRHGGARPAHPRARDARCERRDEGHGPK